MFLEYGIDEHEQLIHVDHARRGKTALRCPYCGGELIARKGQVLAHHFAHAGETCRQASRRGDPVGLPAFDRFDLNIPGRLYDALQRWHRDERVGRREVANLDRAGLIKFNSFAGRWGEYELTYKGGIPLGVTSLQKFGEIQRELIAARHGELVQAVKQARSHPDEAATLFDLRIYRAQWRRVLSAALYFLQVEADGQRYHKIGITTRPLDERLQEIAAALAAVGIEQVSIEALDTWPHRGSLERYFIHRYSAHTATVGTFTEYFTFDEAALRKALSYDLRRLKPVEFTDLERAILEGQPAAIDEEIRQEQQAQAARSAAIREGMAEAAARGVHIGRPADSTREILEKYPAVVAALRRGLSLRKAAARAGVAVNTVRKVKQAMRGE